MSKAIPVNMKANIHDFHRIEKRLAQARAEIDSNMEMTTEEKEAAFESILNHYTGPATGIKWDDESGKVSIASGFHADPLGNVVKD